MMTMRKNLNDDDYQVSGAMRRHGVDCGTLARGVKVSLTEHDLFGFLLILVKATKTGNSHHNSSLKVVTSNRNPSHCTHSSHRWGYHQCSISSKTNPERCHHAAHAYTGVPCSKYRRRRARRDHQAQDGVLPRLAGGGAAKSGRLRSFNPKDPVTLQLKHGGGSQAIRLPTDKLEQNKKYYVRCHHTNAKHFKL